MNDEDMLDAVYVDPLEGDLVLQTLLSANTTFVVGRKGTGKSTVFAKAQSVIRKERKNLGIYLDVKTIHAQVQQLAPAVVDLPAKDVDERALRGHLFRKQFLGTVLSELIAELTKSLESLGFLDVLLNRGAKYKRAIERLQEIASDLEKNLFHETELPVLQMISYASRSQSGNKSESKAKTKAALAAGKDNSAKLEMEASYLEEVLRNEEMASTYSSAVLRTLPFAEILGQIYEVLDGAELARLYVFLDDFSEIHYLDQRLFVDVILTPLNNTSNERVKLKVAAYPGRVYFGGIDPSKIDHQYLDFYELYRSDKLPEIEDAAIAYTKRLLEARCRYYDVTFEQYVADPHELTLIYRTLFEASFNIPRVLGYLLHFLHQDVISKGKKITRRAIRNASQRYFEQILEPYFQANAYALEPYETKLDRFNQKKLLELIVGRARAVRKGIATRRYRNVLFERLSNPPTSHFTVASGLEPILASLEFNQFLSRYHQMRDKDGNDVAVYALNMGLCEREELEWGYPRAQRYDKDYFKQRVFSLNSLLNSFLTSAQAVVCSNCQRTYPMEMRKSIEDFGWLCQQCGEKACAVKNLDAGFSEEFETLAKSIKLEAIELDILQVLHEERQPLRAKEISVLLDTTYQMVGKRTEKLKDMHYVDKRPDEEDVNRSSLTKAGEETFFADESWRLKPSEPEHVKIESERESDEI